MGMRMGMRMVMMMGSQVIQGGVDGDGGHHPHYLVSPGYLWVVLYHLPSSGLYCITCNLKARCTE